MIRFFHDLVLVQEWQKANPSYIHKLAGAFQFYFYIADKFLKDEGVEFIFLTSSDYPDRYYTINIV